MPATQLIATGAGLNSSSEFTLTIGEVATICLKDAEVNAQAVIELKNDAGGFVELGTLFYTDRAKSINSPGTYRVTRKNVTKQGVCGVFRG